jgi:tetratricopeptide (TPR) repeat protein
MLAAASVEGEAFTAEVIAEVEGVPMPQVINLFSRQLDKQHRLVRAQQIEVDGEKTISTYKFRHILFQKYLYDQLDEIERIDFHARVGAALEGLVGEDKEPYAVYLARHFHEANHVEKAILYYQMAGEVAVGMSGHLEAISHFERALDLVLTLPESDQRDQQELGLQLLTGLAYQAIQGYASEPVGKAFERARELSQIVGDAELAKRSFQLLRSYYSNIAQFEIAKEINDLDNQTLDRSTELGNLEYYWGNGYLELCIGKLGRAFEKFTKMLNYYDLDNCRVYMQYFGMEAGILGNGHAAVLAACVGYPERARKHIRNILSIAEAWKDSAIVQTDAMWYPAWTYYELGDYNEASEHLKRAFELAGKNNIFWITAFLKVLHGRLLGQKGEYEEAITNINEGLEILNMIGFATYKPFIFHGLAEVYCAAGKVEEGLDIVREAEAFADGTGGQRFSSPIQKIKGDLLLANDGEGAEAAYLNAISIARQQEAKMFELQAAIGLCRLWEKQGKRQQAIELLQPVYDWFTEGFDNPWLIEARGLLEKIPTESNAA